MIAESDPLGGSAPRGGEELDRQVAASVLDLVGDAVLVTDLASGRIVRANRALLRLMGMSGDAAGELCLSELWVADSDALAALLDRLREDGRARLADQALRRGDGATVAVSGEARLVSCPHGDVVVFALHRLVDPIAMPDSSDHARRLERIGLLAGGIAHDFNNLLTGILGQASLALAVLPKDSPARAPIHKAAGAAGRAADLTRQLLAYAGKGQYHIVDVDLNGLIIENIGLQEAALPRQVRLKLDLDPELPSVHADRGQMQQVLMNLVSNAAEAIGSGPGHVWVRTSVRHISPDMLDEDEARRLLAGDYVCLEVEDDGSGMTPDTLAHIFDPFFSTKGSGRGLGLSATRGIVRAHKGGMLVATAPGEGTRFQVLFPVAEIGPRQPAPAVPISTHRPEGEHPTVLVIDDEAAVREVTVDMLQVSGIPSVVAADGATGLVVYREQRDRIGLVLLDMQMPGLTGEETMAALKELDPDVRVVVISGYGESEAMRRFTGSGVHSFLQKPYDLEALLRTVDAAME